MELFADLHMHSNYSDGEIPPIEVYQIAIEVGLKAAALTDHDTVEGVLSLPQALIEADLFIPGVEISASETGLTCHILGYFHHSSLNAVAESLSECEDNRLDRMKEMLEGLQKAGIDLSIEELLTERLPSKLVGRPHLASLMVRKGYVDTKQEAFDEYLSNDKPYYVPYKRMTPKQAIETIHDAKGLAFIAHPAKDNLDNRIKYLVDSGIDGIEIWHYSHIPAAEEYYQRQAAKFNLLLCGGSDFHYYAQKRIVGTKGVTEERYLDLKDRLKR